MQHAPFVRKLEVWLAADEGTAKQMLHLAAAVDRLDLQSSELQTQVNAETQAQQLLTRLSGEPVLRRSC